MLNKRIFASILLLAFLFALNILQGFLKKRAHSINMCKEKFFIEVAYKGKRAKVMGFCSRPHLGILEKGCDFRNGLSIKVLRNGQVICRDMSAYKKVTLGIPISINKEGTYGLCAIPGIGPYIAKQIVKERKRKGRYRNLNELLQIKGIGKKLYKKILPYISL